MTIYNYDYENKEFLASSIARINPLEEGKYLVPANATVVEVIKEKKGFARCFIDNIWTYIEDNRGQAIHDTETNENSICDYLGSIKDGFALGKYEIPPKTAAEIEAELIAEYKTAYLSVFNAKLTELDYDDIATVGVWAIKDGSQFQAEAKTLLNWYEAIINKNYEILNAVKVGTREMPNKEQYLSELPSFATYEL